ncbi:cysteine-rich CWC family protein [Leptospira alstonii]|uniref:Cysteine-rich CWC n=2 Tax=Leptospira alstonii TaxID=28452 RepID=M6D4S4_9LEPT|nr:cysteine-rich CWC family protein [Leptospira alstonii]EMJ97691.1 cysteine-rich CWC [Leptospira alstonii serovar Sichuan str. 79601]EQA79373.1 cysteine-rich CWC [Leptospira alstonii serovar Pingchang str. 80-412]
MSEVDLSKSGIVSKSCQRCGKIFDCGAAANSCECFSLNLSSELLKQLKGDYGDCLCVFCLKELKDRIYP